MRRAHSLRYVSVGRVRQEELPLGGHGGADVLLPVDVLLTAVHHADVAWGTTTIHATRRRPESTQASGRGRRVSLCGPSVAGGPTSSQGQELVLQDVLCVRSLVHQVQFGDDANGAKTLLCIKSVCECE